MSNVNYKVNAICAFTLIYKTSGILTSLINILEGINIYLKLVGRVLFQYTIFVQVRAKFSLILLT